MANESAQNSSTEHVEIGRNLGARRLDALEWGAGKDEASLQTVYDYVARQAFVAGQWYFERKNRPKSYAQVFRALAIVAVTFGTIWPLVAQLNEALAPVWSTFGLAIGGAILAADRYLGLSTMWTRYVLTGQKIHDRLDHFRLEWRRELSRRRGKDPEPEQVDRALELCIAFHQEIQREVQDETRAWAEEFHRTLKLIEAAARSRGSAGSQASGLSQEQE